MSLTHHGIEPVYNEQSKILILGSFPSVKSRESHFFYGHPQNRFWRVLADVLESELPITIEQKTEFLLKHHIAVWDVIASCEIKGSSDSSIKNVIPNDIDRILSISPIVQIYTNGNASAGLYDKYCLKLTEKPAIKLPSTSPANAAFTLERLLESWSCIRNYLT